MQVYADSSFLMSLYCFDKCSEAALRFYDRMRQPSLLFTPYHRLEVRNGVRQRIQRKKITMSQSRSVLQDIEDDLDDGTLYHESLNWTELLRRAEIVSHEHTPKLGCRAFDVLHVAAALEFDSDLFVSFDEQQLCLADEVGLNVLKPV